MMCILASVLMVLSMTLFLNRTFVRVSQVMLFIVSCWAVFASLSLLNFLRIAFSVPFGWFEPAFLLVAVICTALQIRNFRRLPLSDEIRYVEFKMWEWTVIAGCLIAFTILFYNKSPRWGDWDAWAIWNMHGRFLFHEEYFTRLFTNRIMWTHPDYPMMTPSLMTLFWKSLGSFDPAVPYLMAYLTGISIILLLFLQVRMNSTPGNSIFLLVTLCLTPVVYRFATSQYADSPQALFFLLPLILFEWHQAGKTPNIITVVLIGFFAGAASWVKNEGLFFCMIFATFFIFQNRSAVKNIFAFLAGVVGPLMVLCFFKLQYAPQNDLLQEGMGKHIFEKIADPHRYQVILFWLFSYLPKDALIPFLLTIFAIMFFRIKKSMALQMLLCMMIVYFAVLLTTPYEISYHVENSINRLMHQVTPIVLLVLFSSVYYRNGDNAGKSVCWTEVFKGLLKRIKK